MNWRSRNQRARHDISRARLRALESSLENGQAWVPSSPAHRKTWEEEVDPLSVNFPPMHLLNVHFAKNTLSVDLI